MGNLGNKYLRGILRIIGKTEASFLTADASKRECTIDTHELIRMVGDVPLFCGDCLMTFNFQVMVRAVWVWVNMRVNL